MTAQIIQFMDYQNSRGLAMHGDIETRLADLNQIAAEVFNALMIDTAAVEYGAPDKIIEDALSRRFAGNFFDKTLYARGRCGDEYGE
jgi:hypothetical protein